MKKHSKLLLLPILSALFTLGVASCGSTPNGNTGGDIPLPEVDDPDKDIPTVEFDESDFVSHGSLGGFLIDIDAHLLLAENHDYLCSFSPSTTSDGQITFRVAKGDSISIIESNGTEFKIHGKAIGDSVLQIYDSMENLVYRNIIRVRKAYSSSEVIKACYDNDVYRGYKMCGNHRMTFLNSETVSSVQLRGNDDYEQNINLIFSATYQGYIEASDLYEYSCEITDNPNGSQTKITYLYINSTASEIKSFYRVGGEDHIFSIFVAAKYAKYYQNGFLY